MAPYAHLETEVTCPACGAVVETAYGLLWFRWGYCPSYQPLDDFIYRLGDSVQWRTCADGTTPAWTFFQDDPARRQDTWWGGGNLGDPTVLDLLVQDAAQFYRNPGEERRRCARCGAALVGAVIEIRQGVFRRARVYAPGEFDPAIDLYAFAPDGTPSPMPHWTNHSMDVREGC